MESKDNQTTEGPPEDLYDYSNVVTFAAGKESNRQYFAFDEPRLCRESPYFEDRLHGDYPEARTRHFDFADVDPPVLACMLCWYRGWSCATCDDDINHVKETYLLAERCCIPRFKEHLVKKMQARTSSTDMGRAQRDSPPRLCGDDKGKIPATDPGSGFSQLESKDRSDQDN